MLRPLLGALVFCALPLRVVADMPPVEQGGVGALRVGKPLPRTLLDAAELGRRYTTRFYADAQPLEGFVLDDPPLYVVVSGGPFAKYGHAHPGEAAPTHVRRAAVKRARAGTLVVEMLVVTSPELRTARGLRVGSSWREVKAALPGAALTRLPGLWEEPTCLVRDGDLAFFFATCPARAGLADDSTIIRIVVRRWN